MSEPPAPSEQQDDAEADVEGFRKDLGPFVVAAEATRMPMVFTDARQPNNSIIFANDSFVDLVGYQREEILGHGFNFILANPADAGSLAEIEAEFEGSFRGAPEVRCRRKDGAMFWAALYVSPVRDDNGDTIQHFASFVDLTRQKEEQARSGALIDELNDRVRNMLAAIQSIVSQAFRRGDDPEATREFIASRITALSRTHALLAHGDWGRVGLRDLVDEALKPLVADGGRPHRSAVVGENIRLPPKPALALGIALHELLLNAVAYGALSNDAGLRGQRSRGRRGIGSCWSS